MLQFSSIFCSVCKKSPKKITKTRHFCSKLRQKCDEIRLKLNETVTYIPYVRSVGVPYVPYFLMKYNRTTVFTPTFEINGIF